MPSPLMRGEWIEIVAARPAPSPPASPLMRGEWIEMRGGRPRRLAVGSPLMRGEWIEMGSHPGGNYSGGRLPSCEGSGLKWFSVSGEIGTRVSPHARGVD